VQTLVTFVGHCSDGRLDACLHRYCLDYQKVVQMLSYMADSSARKQLLVAVVIDRLAGHQHGLPGSL
jgi:hypothetical protein